MVRLTSLFKELNLNLTCLFILVVFYIYSTFFFITAYNAQSGLYIDENFHVPQARRYCAGNFEWDPMITTPPGLYVVSVGILKFLSLAFGVELCTRFYFRLFNLIILYLNLFVVYILLKRTAHNSRLSEMTRLKYFITAFNLTIFPVSYFYGNFYYTDVLSMFLIHLTYLLHLQSRDFLTFITGVMSVLVRQTNIAWIIFIIAIRSFGYINDEAAKRVHPIGTRTQRSFKYIPVMLKALRSIIFDGDSPGRSALFLILNLLMNSFGLVLVCVGFFIFVIWNGGVVLGDKEAHIPVIHINQLFYFSLFVSVFTFPFFVTTALRNLKQMFGYKKLFGIFGVLVALCVHFNTMEHIYLLSDNRHYSFYVWKRLFSYNEYVPYFLIPFYLVCIFCMGAMTPHVKMYYKISYILAVTLSIVPQKLFEFRYFILPYTIFRIHVENVTWYHLIVEFIFFFSLNYAVFSIFTFHTFVWPDGSVQRISW